MTRHERLEAFFRGERPDRAPFTIYAFFIGHLRGDPQMRALLDEGLTPTHWFSPTGTRPPADLEVVHDDYEENGESIRRQTQRTPVGEISQTWANNWHRDYLLKTAEDYRVMTWIVRNSEVTDETEGYAKALASTAPTDAASMTVSRTPIQNILVDYAGLEAFSYHLFDIPDAVRELYDAMLEQFARRVAICAEAPGTYACVLENFTAETLGPAKYAEFMLPVYEKYFPILQQAGKVVGTHYDGKTASCRDEIARAPIDVIESFTEPPEGDMPMAKARAAWPEKRFWANIRVSDYQLPPGRLRQRVLDLWQDGAPAGHGLAFEVSEDFPANWRTSLPAVLSALRETGG